MSLDEALAPASSWPLRPRSRSGRSSSVADRTSVDERLEAVLREERGRLTAVLVRILRDWDTAEELVQDAAVSALEHWPLDGIPTNAGAWLMTAARRKAVDRLRRAARYRERMHPLTAEASQMHRPIRPKGRWAPTIGCASSSPAAVRR